jgi:hypothetical protein
LKIEKLSNSPKEGNKKINKKENITKAKAKIPSSHLHVGCNLS